ncbi:MAG TPA: 2Fe-2S iron-sulfur cluster-binding protein [Steroidobacteraceae bacterium]|nr:2Fe-2S iron-sulfur cluster-binding protein [Steroidobacteraceae bacterium]
MSHLILPEPVPRDFAVRIEPHGRTLRVRADQPILTAALAAGLNLPHSCKSGHCSSCRARLRTGEIRYPISLRPPGLTTAEADAGNILLCQARPLTDLVLEARFITTAAEVEIKTLPCRIARTELLAPDVMRVWLRLPVVETLRFQAGQYVDVLLEGGRRRSFSIASPPHDSNLLELHVRRVPGGGFTDRLFIATDTAGQSPSARDPKHDPLTAGSLLRIEGPIGQFTYRPSAAPVLMIAGGTGFAPLKSILRHLLETEKTERDIHFYWGARQQQDLYEETLILDWVRHHPHLHFTAVLSNATRPGAAHRRLGWVHEAVLADHPDLTSFDVYAAGPPALIEAIRSTFPTRGLGEDRLRFDSFDYAPDR